MEDGRSFVRRSQDRYQVMQATLVDTWASTAAGAFALTENNLYTSDAVRDYLSAPHRRWHGGFHALGLRPAARIAAPGFAGHARARARWAKAPPPRHVIVGRKGSVQGWGAQDTVLISRKPFSSGRYRARARVLCATSNMEAVYYPGSATRNPFRDLLLSADPAEYQRALPLRHRSRNR